MFILRFIIFDICILICASEASISGRTTGETSGNHDDCDHSDSEHWCTDHLAVQIRDKLVDVDAIADEHGFTNLGQIGSLEEYYLFKKKEGRRVKRAVGQQLMSHPSVDWLEPQIAKRRTKRDFLPEDELDRRSKRDAPQLPWKDPLYSKQWYLHGGAEGGYDMKVAEAWKLGYSGRNVVVTILDDGVQPDHPDLKANFDPRASKDINAGDDDPTPQDNGDNKHGTRCAGEVAAVAGNDWCGVGIAYNARIGGVRMLDGPVSDAVEGASLSLHQDYIDIYSASWGPEDDGRTVDGPGRLAKEAFLRGITEGRDGKGNIFIWASGNGGNFQDSCSCDGYTTSIYTLSVSSATFNNQKPWYLEECPSSLATTYSSANMNQPAIVTTDMPNSCTDQHTGTSASAPIAAGIVALTLEANRNLTWRDMQHLVIRTSDPTPLLNNDGWSVNAVGRKISTKFGYGMMNAEGMARLGRSWQPLPPQRVCTYKYDIDKPRPLKGRFSLNYTLTVDGCSQGPAILYVEHVQPVISIQFSKRGDLKLSLISPSKTKSVLLPARSNDASRTGFQKWPFLSVQQWGENPNGEWTLIAENVGSEENYGEFRDWSLTLYGTETPAQPGDPVTPGSSVGGGEVGAGGAADIEFRTGDRSKNEVDIPRHVSIPRGSSQQARSGANAYGDSGYGGGRTVSPPIFHDQCNPECVQAEGCYQKHSATGCVTCQNFKVRLRNRSGFKCIPKCERGFYTDSQAKQCVMCHSDCSTCSGPNYCDECPKGDYLVEVDPENLHHGRCVQKCPDEFKVDITDPNTPKCVTVCGANCLDCDGNLCRRCKEKYFLTSDRRCVNACGDGYFNDSTKRECVECSVSFCVRCSSVAVCMECISGYVWNDGTKQCQKRLPVQMHCAANDACPSGSFCDKSTQSCVECYPDCAECMGPSFDHCTKCKNGQLVDPRTRQCPSCKSGQYFDAEQNACFQCPANCTVCAKPGRCVECASGFGLENGHCLKCCKDRRPKLDCAVCPKETPKSQSRYHLSLTKVVVLLCIGGVAFFFLVFGILMWKDRNYGKDAKKYAYSKVPILYDIGSETQLVVDPDNNEKGRENGYVIHSDNEDEDDDEFDTGLEGEDTVFDKKYMENPR